MRHDRVTDQGPVVQSFTSSLRVISLTVIADSIHNILILFADKKSYSHFFSKKFQHICISLDVNFNESKLTLKALVTLTAVTFYFLSFFPRLGMSFRCLHID